MLPPKSIKVLSALGLDDETAMQVELLSREKATRGEVQSAISRITRHLINSLSFQSKKTVLVPVVRSGLGMWVAANDILKQPETMFPEGRKDRETGEVAISLNKIVDLSGKDILILDPIVATGDTIIATIDILQQTQKNIRSITVLSCYAAPEGVSKIIRASPKVRVIIGCLSQGMDEKSYLIPKTHGDMGDKLYGKTIN